MIRFSLICDAGHGFESWFADNASFDTQAKRGFVECPACGSVRVGKAIMAPHVARSDRAHPAPVPSSGDTRAAGNGGQASSALPVATPPADKVMRDLIRAVRQHVEATADHVGDRFADEALKIHHGEVEHRAIYGSATPEDARMLVEEGVTFQQLPVLPDKLN